MNGEKKDAEALEYVVAEHVIIVCLLRATNLALLNRWCGLLLDQAIVGKVVKVELCDEALQRLELSRVSVFVMWCDYNRLVGGIRGEFLRGWLSHGYIFSDREGYLLLANRSINFAVLGLARVTSKASCVRRSHTFGQLGSAHVHGAWWRANNGCLSYWTLLARFDLQTVMGDRPAAPFILGRCSFWWLNLLHVEGIGHGFPLLCQVKCDLFVILFHVLDSHTLECHIFARERQIRINIKFAHVNRKDVFLLRWQWGVTAVLKRICLTRAKRYINGVKLTVRIEIHAIFISLEFVIRRDLSTFVGSATLAHFHRPLPIGLLSGVLGWDGFRNSNVALLDLVGGHLVFS